MLSTVAGNGARGFGGDGVPALQANLNAVNGALHCRCRSQHPQLAAHPAHRAPSPVPGIFSAPNDDLYILDSAAYVRVVRAATGNISLIASAAVASTSLPVAPGVPATAFTLTAPRGTTTDRRNGDIYIADAGSNAVFIFRNSALYGTRVFVFAGTGVACTAFLGPGAVCGDGGSAATARLNFPYGLSVNAAGDVAIADQNTNRVRIVTSATGVINTVLGTGSKSYGAPGVPADGVLGTASVISIPQGLAFDAASGDLFVADPVACVIRRVFLSGAQAGFVFNVAGTAGSCGSSAAPTPPLAARIGPSYFLAFRPSDGALLFSDGTYSVVCECRWGGKR